MIRKTEYTNKHTKQVDKIVPTIYSRTTSRSGYYWCNKCNGNSSHLIFLDHHTCLCCKIEIYFNNTDSHREPVTLFMI